MNTKVTLFLILICYAFITSIQAETPTVPDKYVYIISPANGEVVHSPLLVKFGLRGMGVAPAGVEKENTGHHHLLIDVDFPPLDKEIPSDRNHIHFGTGQTQTRLELQPGKHTLQLLLGDHNHVPHQPPVFSKKITIIIK